MEPIDWKLLQRPIGKMDGQEFGRFLEELDKLPRGRKRGYRLALPGEDPMRFRRRRWRSKYGGWYWSDD